MFESEAHTERGSPSLVGRGIAKPYPQFLFSSFEDYLKAQKKRNIKQIMHYAQKYAGILETEDAAPLLNLSSGACRRHAMEALSALSKYNGCYNTWQEIRRRYSLKWTNGNESVQSLERFFNPELSLDVMIQRIRQMVDIVPPHMGKIIQFAVLVGLRPTEVLESVRLINNPLTFSRYFNAERKALEHFRFPEQFIRQTKKAFISFVSPEMLSITSERSDAIPTYNAIRHVCNKRGIRCDLHLTRKIFASWLHQCSITAEEVDFLQGRVSTSVFSRHYLTPDSSLRTRVLESIGKLKQEIEQ